MERILKGFLAGMSATAPMTVVMLLIHRLLPSGEQYPVPPYEVTEEAIRDAGLLGKAVDKQESAELALLAHFGFGGLAGTLYGALSGLIPLPGAAAGALYSLLVWAVNYLGLLPAAGLYRAPDYEPARRHAMMVAAHLVWGAVLGWLLGRMAGDEEQAAPSWQRRAQRPHRQQRPEPPFPRTPAKGERYSF
jgi:uncharacterized membrane protein YagU involved in acid resistance